MNWYQVGLLELYQNMDLLTCLMTGYIIFIHGYKHQVILM